MISKNRLRPLQSQVPTFERIEHVLGGHVFDYGIVSLGLSFSCLDAIYYPVRFDNVDLIFRLRVQEFVCC